MDGKHKRPAHEFINIYYFSLPNVNVASVICNIYPHWSSFSLYALAALRMAAARKYEDYSISRICRFIQLEFAFAICTSSTSSRSLSTGQWPLYYLFLYISFSSCGHVQQRPSSAVYL